MIQTANSGTSIHITADVCILDYSNVLIIKKQPGLCCPHKMKARHLRRKSVKRLDALIQSEGNGHIIFNIYIYIFFLSATIKK